ncbi:hypothetical protein [Tautonia plasticadhaerens]|uniref:Uncharacterized protein n=1 Tax=Tautonia plasticadhaerens TaxID=2527974 RepID=A0A518H1K6_9BACT|nr:hypothetical protein [Tautonia plasticadhaerens]QDV34711.1 hypothetical protein ElP_26050 [Tautonia plasticadhaerens]
MKPIASGRARGGVGALALGLMISAPGPASGFGTDGPPAHHGPNMGVGTLGYGPPGPRPGYQGFGLKFHKGHGYGGKDALGVGALGGYPDYGGPGYPHHAPPLRRLGRFLPFRYRGGEGMPSAFRAVGPLSRNRDVVTQQAGGGPSGDFGRFTGALPYPEAAFSPFASTPTDSASEAAPRAVPEVPPPAPIDPGPFSPPGLDLEGPRPGAMPPLGIGDDEFRRDLGLPDSR